MAIRPLAAMLLTTTPGLEGRTIRRYLGLVHGETILGANLFRDLLASIRDLIGGRARAYERCLVQARQLALDELSQRARQLNADAVVGVQIDVEVLGQGGILLACATGTAVQLEPPAPKGTTAPPPPPPGLPGAWGPGA